MNATTKKLRPDLGEAFVPDAARNHERLADDEAEAFAEEFIAEATSAEYIGEDARDETTAEELGGPFLELVVDPKARKLRFLNDDEPEV